MRVFSLITLVSLTILCSQLKAQYSNTFIDPRDSSVYPIIKIGDQKWFAKNINYDNEELNSEFFTDADTEYSDEFGRFYGWQESSAICPEGWRLPTKNDIDVLIASLNGSPNERGGKVVYIGQLNAMKVKMAGLNVGAGRVVAKGSMEVWLTSSDTTWNNPDPQFAKYNGHKIIGLHIYSKLADSLIIEPTYIDSSLDRKVSCRCMKE